MASPISAGETHGQGGRECGFTIVELMVVMAIVATLLSLVSPRYFHSAEKAREIALQTNLRTIRDAIDQHVADQGHYPETLGKLVERRYLRQIPVDPMTERHDTWVVLPHPDKLPGVYDVRGGSNGEARDATAAITH